MTQYQAETTVQASAVGHRSATAVAGIWQPPVLFLGPNDGGNGNDGGNNGGGSSGTSDPGTSDPVLATMLLAYNHGV
jgi:hypothetical protein